MKKILLIDDDKILTGHYLEALRIQGFDVTICHTIKEAFKVDVLSFDLIICDLMMPSDGFFQNIGTRNNLITGLRFVEQNRSDGCKIPCVLLTNLNLQAILDGVKDSVDRMEDVIVMRKSEFDPLEFAATAMSLIDKTAFKRNSNEFRQRIVDSIILKAPIIPGFLTIDIKKLFGKSK